MTTHMPPMDNSGSSFMTRLRNAGIEPGDSEDLRQQKSLLVFMSGLVSLASVLWLMIYGWMGPNLSSSLPFGLQVLVAFNLWVYIQFRNFDLFRISQIGLLLFFPFVAQWALGDFVSASGLILWGLLAPICALLCMGVRESLPWFFAYVVLTLMTGASDYLLADMVPVTLTTHTTISRQTSVVFFALNFVTLSTLVYLLLRFALLDRAKARASLEEAHTKLAAEQERSERLLLNILPAPIAHRLRASDATIADGFAEVSVMFADIVNFTGLAADMEADQVFAMLNRVFSSFDELAERHGLEKIKTIGDAYMVAGGLSDELPDACCAVAELALDMHEWLRRDQTTRGEPLHVRIGIGTGPVVAGVVGKKKFIYDLWGDTVNLASRITDEGLPDGIQCDRASYELLKGRFTFEAPVILSLKGKGKVEVWRLSGRIASSSAARQTS
ncbi:adenylate/guanylate cyclase domain-containing protein [Uliginosibacterium sp. H3]|uniref:Adenylate/guanylate cyclase domain-containing protein n=1 Tax=Uliginosibacterium silvisoli TaxID=3114758 RepID=A0ABU6K530_9RHOO|nr:adenylate/guanylate cyclase domain-containing protein [Uliginosibacterium sp. H3]